MVELGSDSMVSESYVFCAVRVDLVPDTKDPAERQLYPLQVYSHASVAADE
jgi:hypothetical protein